MKKIMLLCLFLICITSISCGDSDKEKASGGSENNRNKQVELILEFKAPLNDKFKVFYTKAPNEEITGKYVIDKLIYGNNNMQKVIFKFPKGDFPHLIRLDVGTNQAAESIMIKNISIAYGDKLIDGDDGVFMQNWSPNDNLAFDEPSLSYKLIAVNGKKEPVFMSNVIIQKQLRQMFKK